MEKRYRKMVKNARGKVMEIQDGKIMLELPIPVAEIIGGMPEAVRSLSEEVGLMIIRAAMESECERIAGPKDMKNPQRTANWWGSEIGAVYYDGQKHMVERPRLREKDNGEIGLETYKAFRDPKGMTERIMKRMILGLSSRNYEETVDSVIKGYGIKKSSVSRHFVKATVEQMREFMERSLSGLELCAIFIDGIEFKKQRLIVALGISKEGKKHILGLWQGATENGEVCRMMLEDLIRRGLDIAKNYLFVLDGSKALRSSVTRVFGDKAKVQRCQEHKIRNVKAHLTPAYQGIIGSRMRAAYEMTDYEQAKLSLEQTAIYLEKINSCAAASLKEGLEETLTVHKLGVTGLLRETLCSTNPIESTFSVSRDITGRVKCWKNGDMIQRWAVASLLRAEKKFHRVRGYRAIPALMAALKQNILDIKEVAA